MSDATNRRTILHDLQQTKTRLQKLQEDRPNKVTNQSSASPVLPLPQRPPTAPPPAPSISPQDSLFISKQQKVALQQAITQSQGYYVTQPSPHGNLVIPVLPRFNDKGQLLPMS